jgi:hypothetical protein
VLVAALPTMGAWLGYNRFDPRRWWWRCELGAEARRRTASFSESGLVTYLNRNGYWVDIDQTPSSDVADAFARLAVARGQGSCLDLTQQLPAFAGPPCFGLVCSDGRLNGLSERRARHTSRAHCVGSIGPRTTSASSGRMAAVPWLVK